MKNTKKLATLVGTVALVGALSVTAFAASSYSTPAEVLAGLTGRTAASVTAERRASGVTYGSIAAEAGKLQQFKDETLEMKKGILAQRVTDGVMTQEEADTLLAAIEENQAICEGSGNGQRLGLGIGARFGQGSKAGTGARRGGGRGMGGGRGVGYGNGASITP